MERFRSKKKILFVIPKLDRGGAERVVLTLLKNLDRKQFELHLALIARAGKWCNKIPDNVTVHSLEAGQVRKGLFQLVLLILRLNPDTIFSTVKEANLSTCFIKTVFFPKINLVIRETNPLSSELGDKSKMPKLWHPIYRNFYPRANSIICLAQFISQDLQQHFSIPIGKMVCIPNPIDIDKINKTAEQSNNPFIGKGVGPHIVTAGRLVHQKGIDRLLKAFPKLLELKENAKLWILGEGPLEFKYKRLRDSIGLKDCVHFPGFQENIYAWFKHADLFILPSRYEGMPNALLEAMACGCPVVAIEHPGGTREIMELTGQLERLSPNFDWDPKWFIHNSDGVIKDLHRNFDISVVACRYAAILYGTAEQD